MKATHHTLKALMLLTACLLLFSLNLLVGSVSIPLTAVADILLGRGSANPTWQFIVVESRLPQAITAMLAGSALGVSGLLLQTLFRNPLADPSIFGISSGAGLGVALVVLMMGGTVSVGICSLSGTFAILFASLAGAVLVMLFILFFSTIVRGHAALLIVGIMIGYLASSAISLLNFFATEEGVKSYLVWGMGNFGGVNSNQLPLFSVLTLLGIIASALMMKPLDALLLGDSYAQNLGFNIRRLRFFLLLVTGTLTAVITTFCGPVSFLGLAIPHLAKALLHTDSHRQLLPATVLGGALLALLCNLVCMLPFHWGIIPLNAVTPLVGAPVIIRYLCKSSW